MATTMMGNSTLTAHDRKIMYWGITITAVILLTLTLTMRLITTRDTVSTPASVNGLPTQKSDVQRPPVQNELPAAQ